MTLIIRNREELEHHLVAMHGENWSIRGLAPTFFYQPQYRTQDFA